MHLKRLAILFISLVMVSCVHGSGTPAVANAGPQGSQQPSPAAEPSAVMPLGLLGRGPLYVYDLGSPHTTLDPRLVLEVELSHPTANPLALYRTDQVRTGEQLYALLPEPLAMTEFLARSPKGGARTTFSATLYRGHPGGRGQVLLANIHVLIRRVIFPLLVPAKSPPPAATFSRALEYFFFGNEQELFAMHLGGTAHEFRHIAAVRLQREIATPGFVAAVEAGAVANFPLRQGESPQPLRRGTPSLGVFAIGQTALPAEVEVTEDIQHIGRSAPQSW